MQSSTRVALKCVCACGLCSFLLSLALTPSLFLIDSIQGMIRVSCALEDLSVGLSYRARGEEGGPLFGPGHTPSLNGGTAGTTPPGYAGFNPLAAGEYDPADSLFNSHKPSATASSSTSSARRARAPRPSCPTFLYGSWMRIENGAVPVATGKGDTGAADPPPTQQGSRSKRESRKISVSSVVLRFSADSYERVESHSTAGRRRVSQQRWTGPLRVECEWDEMEEEQEEEDGETEEEEEEGKENGNDDRSTQADAAALLRLSDELKESLAMPTRAAASITVRIPATSSAHQPAAQAPMLLRFTYLPLLFQGNKGPTPVLVERSDGERDAAWTSSELSARPHPVFIKL